MGGYEAAEDCTADLAEATCAPDQDDVGCFLGSDCAPVTDNCSGTILNFCAAGLQQSLDCSSLGFTSCTDGRCQP
jgi:hypothetical protein